MSGIIEVPKNELEKLALANSLIDEKGNVSSPICCGQKMDDDGGCSEGCCDDFKCSKCGTTIRIEWPD